MNEYSNQLFYFLIKLYPWLLKANKSRIFAFLLLKSQIKHAELEKTSICMDRRWFRLDTEFNDILVNFFYHTDYKQFNLL